MRRRAIILIMGILFPAFVSGAASDKTWSVPSPNVVRQELVEWLGGLAETKQDILAPWPESEPPVPGNRLLERTVDSMRRGSLPIAAYLDHCDTLAWRELPFGQPLILPQPPIQIYMSGSNSSRYLLGSLRLYLALRLIQARLYDEAASILEDMKPESCVDPVGACLARAVVCDRLGETEKGLAALKDFYVAAENDVSVPRRHLELAKLLEFDLKKEKRDENQETISRKMDDVRRRLGKGRTDDDTQQAESDVMKSLDKLIEKIEDQAKKQASADCDQGQQSNNPAEDSRILKQKGPGNVDRRDFDSNGNWGDLPPKEREEALLRIEKEFPAYYRDIIEQYFREMAETHKK